MAKEDERSTAADKGKDKVDDARELNGSKKPQKEDKPQVNGKKDEEAEGIPPFPFPTHGFVSLRSPLVAHERDTNAINL